CSTGSHSLRDVWDAVEHVPTTSDKISRLHTSFECSFSNKIIAEGSIMQAMKKFFLLAITGWLLGSGCATKTTVTEDGRAIVPSAQDVPRQAQVGMTREEIESIYGHPARVFIRPNGETW